MEATARDHLKDDVQKSAETVATDFTALRSDISRLAASVQQMAANELGAQVEDLNAKASEQITAAERAIRKNPTQAALIAAGIGFMVGLIMIR
ncbi:MAG: hypothetical protein KDJ47_16635 [Hyphomicrobiaceae bacterium]|nr:hypothetical protein [Caldilineaceae bacterium]MCB1506604.1 hypothetical protein [Hyphomicrobiaceae bacterium]